MQSRQTSHAYQQIVFEVEDTGVLLAKRKKLGGKELKN
jgi:hypothetical protein